MPHTDPIASISRTDPVHASAFVDALAFQPLDTTSGADPVPTTYATHASTCTAFDRYPCILGPAAASIAAAAAAQDMRTFWRAPASRERGNRAE